MSAVIRKTDESLRLDRLLEDVAPVPAGVRLADITLDSRRVVAGSAFFACRGIRGHGLDHAAKAVAAGAAAVVWEPAEGVEPPQGLAVPTVRVPDLRTQIGRIADRWFGEPSSHLGVVGITGTNGKTSVSWLLAEALNRLGRRCAYLGTIGSGFLDALAAPGLTTPDVIELHRRLADFVAAGATHAAIEVSSHALDQRRTDGVRLHAAGFTNLTRDHLDYHGTMEAYGAAKARLMETPGLARRVINADDAFGAVLARRHIDTVLAVTRHDKGDFRRRLVIGDVALDADGIRFAFRSPQGSGSVRAPLRGEFNVENLSVALGLLLELGFAPADAAGALDLASSPPGRLEVVGGGEPLVVVDYAHTPDALESVIAALRPHCAGELWCVFGCGGERDPGKRPLMARAAAVADRVVVTTDNPRGEDPAEIIEAILAGAPAGGGFRAIEDRCEAIGVAIREAGPHDCVLIAGRGHERFQLFADGPRPFSDAAEARAILSERRP